MRLGIARVLRLSTLVLLLATASLQHKLLKIAAAAALFRGGPMIPLPIRYEVPQQTKVVHYPVRVPVHIPVHHHTQQVKIVHVPVHHYTHHEQHHMHHSVYPVHQHHVEIQNPVYHRSHQSSNHVGHIVQHGDGCGGLHGGYEICPLGHDGAYGYAGEVSHAY